MSEQPALSPIPPGDPQREGFDNKYFQAKARAMELYERGGYQGQEREQKGKTQKQLWYRDLAIKRKQMQAIGEQTDNE